MGAVARARKLKQFVTRPDIDKISIDPRPWNSDFRRYYFTNSINNRDGHGGYSLGCRFDEEGVPYVRRGAGRVYHPCKVARYALKLLAIAMVTGEQRWEAQARRMIEPLALSVRDGAPWGPGPSAHAMRGELASSLTQGVVVSALTRLAAPDFSGDVGVVIERAAGRLMAPLGAGGTRSTLDGSPFLAEFPREPPSHILNGCIYGLFGLYDLADALGDSQAASLAAAIEDTLASKISRFVTRLGWSRYALAVYGHAPLSSVHYHRYHIVMARILAQRTGAPQLADAARRWESALAATLHRILNGALKSSQVVWMRDVRRLPLQEG